MSELQRRLGMDDARPRPQVRALEQRRLAPESDIDYFTRRAREELEFANGLADELARDLHRDLSNRYAQLAAAKRAVDEQI